MTVNLQWWSTTPTEGINLTATYPLAYVQTTAISATNDPSNPSTGTVKLGDMVNGNLGSVWVLLQASTTITAYNTVVYDGLFKANNITSAIAISNPLSIGVPQVPTGVIDPVLNPLFWCAIKSGGGMIANCSGSAGTGVVVNTGTAAGFLTVSTTGTTIRGLLFTTSTGTTGTPEIVMNYPHTLGLG